MKTFCLRVFSSPFYCLVFLFFFFKFLDLWFVLMFQDFVDVSKFNFCFQFNAIPVSVFTLICQTLVYYITFQLDSITFVSNKKSLIYLHCWNDYIIIFHIYLHVPVDSDKLFRKQRHAKVYLDNIIILLLLSDGQCFKAPFLCIFSILWKKYN